MIKRNALLFLSLWFASITWAFSQEYRCDSKNIINYYDYNEEERNSAFSNLKKISGYLHGEIPHEFLERSSMVYSEQMHFDKNHFLILGFERLNESVAGLPGEYRNTIYYEFNSGTAKLVRWNIKENGAKVCIPRQIINFENNYFVGTIRLNSSKSSDFCVWKALIVSRESFIQSDFIMETSCKAGRPLLRFDTFLKELKSVLRN